MRQSTGCRNCVNRRVRCDEARPICRKCEKLGLQCGGPRDGALFKISQPGKKQQRRRPQQRENTSSSEDVRVTGSECATSCSLSPWMIRSPAWSKYSNDVHICYLQRNWTDEDEPWIRFTIEDPSRCPTAYVALSTLATAYYGKRNRQPDIVIVARRKYGQALVLLQKALVKGTGARVFDILAASSALQRYEVIVFTTGVGWIQHAGGIARATELSGPDCFSHHPNKAILDANRNRIIQEAYHCRKRTFLTLEKWRNLKTASNHQEAHFEKLQDLYARLAGLTDSVTSFIAGQESRQYCEVLHEANDLLIDLDLWISHWITDFSSRPIEGHISSTAYSMYDDVQGPIFKSALVYPCQLAGVGANIYRALKLTTLEWRHKLQIPSWWSRDDHKGMDEVPEVRQLAEDICRTLHSHYGENGKTVDHIWWLLFCSVIAYKALPYPSREAWWITKTLVNIGDRFGMELARNLTSEVSVQWKEEGPSRAKRSLIE